MKNGKAAWMVLLVITLVASLLLGLTNEVTKDAIVQQESAKAEAARQALEPDAEAFEKLELDEGSALSELYAAQKDGDTIGYVAVVLTRGFGGEVEVTAGFDAEAVLTGISVGGANFSETPGLGAKSKDEAFTGQFAGKSTPLKVIKAGGAAADNTVDAITAATITSNAVTNAVNTAGNAVRDLLGLNEEEGVVTGSRTATASAQGFAGPVAVTITLDDQDAISEITIGDDSFAETDGFGARALEPEVAEALTGLTPPLTVGDVDVLSGATYAKTALVEAINKAAELIKSAPAATSAKASEQGFAGPVAVTLSLDENGAISEITIGDDSFAETEGFGARALEPEVAEALIGLTPPLAVGDVDVLSGATYTKTALIGAINKAAEKLSNAATAPTNTAEATVEAQDAEPDEAEASEPATETETVAAETSEQIAEEAAVEPIEGITVEASGLTGKFPVTVSFNDDGSVKAVT
ncbi:MAG: RnfABCDGE type electron transport complex subunit G, partial [Clostridia bacterium]|nr:RnfABCDGE type electron transport complex subunit G [Clostridia bacterium]